MHGGTIYIRGGVSPHRLSPDVLVCELDDSDWAQLREDIWQYCRSFEIDPDPFLASSFVKLIPRIHALPLPNLHAIIQCEGKTTEGHNVKSDWVCISLIFTALVVTAAAYPHLPEQIPTHWNIHGQPDDWHSRNWAFLTAGVMAAVYFLLSAIPALARGRPLTTRPHTYRQLARAITGFFLAVHLATLAAQLGLPFGPLRLTAAAIGALFAVIGYLLPEFTPNPYAGIRTPWTLADEETWRITHRLNRYPFMAAGGLVLALSLTLPQETQVFLALAVILGLTLAFSLLSSYFVHRGRAHRAPG